MPEAMLDACPKQCSSNARAMPFIFNVTFTFNVNINITRIDSIRYYYY